MPALDAETQRLARKERRHNSRRDVIVDAAFRVIDDVGVAGLTVAAVAEAADVSTPALYYYFKSKEAIVDAIAGEMVNEEWAQVDAALRQATTASELFEAMVKSRVEHYVARPDDFRLLYESSTAISAEVQLGRVRKVVNALIDQLAAALTGSASSDALLESADPRGLAVAAWAQAQGVISLITNSARLGVLREADVPRWLGASLALVRHGCQA